MSKIELKRVKYMPKQLEPGILYVAEEFGAAAHLCPCGCGSKVRTPLDVTEWSLDDTDAGPSLYPSVGNWQKECQSHYWVCKGRIKWEGQWSERQVIKGRIHEQNRRISYYEGKADKRINFIKTFFKWLFNLK